MELNKATAKLGILPPQHYLFYCHFLIFLIFTYKRENLFASSPQAISHTLVCVESCSQDYLLNVLGIKKIV